MEKKNSNQKREILSFIDIEIKYKKDKNIQKNKN